MGTCGDAGFIIILPSLFLSSDTPTPPAGRTLGGSGFSFSFSFLTSYTTDSTLHTEEQPQAKHLLHNLLSPVKVSNRPMVLLPSHTHRLSFSKTCSRRNFIPYCVSMKFQKSCNSSCSPSNRNHMFVKVVKLADYLLSYRFNH